MEQEHYVVEQVAPKWVGTILTSMGATLAAGLLLWIANGQFKLALEQAKTRETLTNFAEVVQKSNNDLLIRMNRLQTNQDRIWPRLRAHGENAEILKREIEALCKCDIELNDPEEY